MSKPKQKPLQLKTATDEDINFARKVIDQAFQPALERRLEVLNQTLASKGIRAGIEITWFFDRIETGETT